MTKWALVEENEITGFYDLLPKNWKNISGLNLSENDTEFLNSLGWYKIESEIQQYDSSLYRSIGHTFSFENNRVIARLRLQQITDQEREVEMQRQLQQQIDRQNNFINRQKEIRNLLLTQSDYVMTADMIEIKGQEWYNTWKVYRQALRDLPQNYPDGNYIWPEIPNFSQPIVAQEPQQP